MKRIGFVASDGTPTDLYKRFRNPATSGAAVAEAIRSSYKELAAANEYFHRLSDKELQTLILQVSGLDHDNRVANAILATLKTLKAFADFDAGKQVETLLLPPSPTPSPPPERPYVDAPNGAAGLGLNLAYTINLNLPATTDQAVFNAIFKSLRENLLSGNE